MNQTRIVKVVFTGNAKEEFEELNKIVGEEISVGIKTSDKHILLNAIKQKVELLKLNPQYGIHIPHDRIPKEYKIKYDANNLWKVNLSGYWRMNIHNKRNKNRYYRACFGFIRSQKIQQSFWLQEKIKYSTYHHQWGV